MKIPRPRAAASAIAVALFAASQGARADLDDVLAASTENVLLAQVSQETVDAVADETDALAAEYARISKELEGLEVYNAYMERQIQNQEAELGELERSIAEISSIERQIMPLMIRMLDALSRFVELDMPFLKAERVERVENLRSLMERADVTVAEKFRRLTEAFLIENDFGRTIETYKETLEIDGQKLEATILRIGRLGLYYQTNDASRTGMWARDVGQWSDLEGGTSRNHVRQGIRIAKKQIAPDLLLLDVPAPESGR